MAAPRRTEEPAAACMKDYLPQPVVLVHTVAAEAEAEAPPEEAAEHTAVVAVVLARKAVLVKLELTPEEMHTAQATAVAVAVMQEPAQRLHPPQAVAAVQERPRSASGLTSKEPVPMERLGRMAAQAAAVAMAESAEQVRPLPKHISQTLAAAVAEAMAVTAETAPGLLAAVAEATAATAETAPGQVRAAAAVMASQATADRAVSPEASRQAAVTTLRAVTVSAS